MEVLLPNIVGKSMTILTLDKISFTFYVRKKCNKVLVTTKTLYMLAYLVNMANNFNNNYCG